MTEREVTLDSLRYRYSTAWWDDYSLTDLDDPAGIKITAEYAAEFDRAIAAHDAQLRAHIAAEIRLLPLSLTGDSLGDLRDQRERAAQIAEGTN